MASDNDGMNYFIITYLNSSIDPESIESKALIIKDNFAIFNNGVYNHLAINMSIVSRIEMDSVKIPPIRG